MNILIEPFTLAHFGDNNKGIRFKTLNHDTIEITYDHTNERIDLNLDRKGERYYKDIISYRSFKYTPSELVPLKLEEQVEFLLKTTLIVTEKAINEELKLVDAEFNYNSGCDLVYRMLNVINMMTKEW